MFIDPTWSAPFKVRMDEIIRERAKLPLFGEEWIELTALYLVYLRLWGTDRKTQKKRA